MVLRSNDRSVEIGDCSNNCNTGAKNLERITITNGSYGRKVVRCFTNNCRWG